MGKDEIGAASFGLVVGLNKFKQQLGQAETAAGQSANRIGQAMTAGIDKSMSAGLVSTGKKMTGFGNQMAGVGSAMTMGLTVPLAAIGGLSIKAAMDFETAFAGVRKTVDATDAELDEMEQSIRDMAKRLPASTTEIAAVAEAAGQLGIQVPKILEFTEVMIGLGESTDLSANDAATALAQLANITQMPQDEFENLASAIVATGNAGASTESQIAAMSLRLAGAGHQVGLSQAEIVGFASALASVGIEAEAGGSAFSRVMVDMSSAVQSGGKELDRFAQVAGVSAGEFATAFERDPAQAMVSFVTGLQRMSDEGMNVFAVLDNLGLGEIRVRDALLRMAGAGDLMTQSIQTSTSAWQENTALQDEVAQRYETSAAKWQIFKNKLADVAIELGEQLIPSLLRLLDASQPLLDMLVGAVKWFSELPEPIQTTVLGIAAFLAVMGPTVLIVGKMISTFGVLITTVGKVMGAMKMLGATAGLTNPYVLALIAAMAATAIIIMNWDKIKKWFNDFKAWISKTSQSIYKAIIQPFVDAAKTIIDAFKAVAQVIADVASAPGRVVSGIKDNLSGWIPGFADGVTNFSGGLALVGERGPELLELPRGSNVHPMDRVGMSSSGGSSGGGSQTIQLVLDRRVVAQVVVDEMSDRERRTGRSAFRRSCTG